MVGKAHLVKINGVALWVHNNLTIVPRHVVSNRLISFGLLSQFLQFLIVLALERHVNVTLLLIQVAALLGYIQSQMAPGRLQQARSGRLLGAILCRERVPEGSHRQISGILQRRLAAEIVATLLLMR